MPTPSRCGWPDATNTGVPLVKLLTVRQGNLTVNQTGAVLDGLDIRGCVTVTARNVTIRNSRITCSDFIAVKVWTGTGSDPGNDPTANLLIEDTDIVLGGLGDNAIAWGGYTMRRVHISGGSDCASANNRVLIEDSFCDIPGSAGQDAGANGGPHVDGIQETGSAKDVTIRHNTIRNPYITVSAIIMNGGTSNIRIVDNLLAGGGFTIYCPPSAALAAFSGNVISKMYYSRGGSFGPTTGCPSTGWRYDG